MREVMELIKLMADRGPSWELEAERQKKQNGKNETKTKLCLSDDKTRFKRSMIGQYSNIALTNDKKWNVPGLVQFSRNTDRLEN